MKIRKATEKDIERLSELQIDLEKYERRFCKILKDSGSVDEYLKKSRERIKREDCVFFVAEEASKIIGYVLGEIEKPAHHYIYENRGFIVDAFISKEHRGKGIGEKLTEKLLEWFKSKGIKWVKVSAFTTNISAIGFWKKMGFKDYVIEMTKIEE